MKPISSTGLLGSLGLMLLLGSCGAVYEDLDPCRPNPSGADVKLIYNRNLAGGDAFASQVHCASLHLFDSQDRYIGTFPTDGNSVSLDLPAGRYHAVAFGGMDCADASFAVAQGLTPGSRYQDLLVSLMQPTRSGVRATEWSDQLHPHFHAAGTVEVTDTEGHDQVTLSLTKNTNNLRVVLQYMDGAAVNPDDYEITVTADNGTTGHDNSVVTTGQEVVYLPWATGTVPMGFVVNMQQNDARPVTDAYAEIHFGRMDVNAPSPVLSIVKKPYGDRTQPIQVAKINLVDYFKLVKSDELREATLQDYLDMQDQWQILLTVDPVTEIWLGVTIKLQDWIYNLQDYNF